MQPSEHQHSELLLQYLRTCLLVVGLAHLEPGQGALRPAAAAVGALPRRLIMLRLQGQVPQGTQQLGVPRKHLLQSLLHELLLFSPAIDLYLDARFGTKRWWRWWRGEKIDPFHTAWAS